MVGVEHSTSISEYDTPMTSRATTIVNAFRLAYVDVGGVFGDKSAFEFWIDDITTKKEFVGGDTKSTDTFQIIDKSGGFALGPLAIGYTDANEYTVESVETTKRPNDLQEKTTRQTGKFNRKGLSLKLSNLFVGVSQWSQRATIKLDLKQTEDSDSSVTNFSIIGRDHVINKNMVAIGCILGKENENRFRLEIYRFHTPKVDESYTLTNHSDGTTSTRTTSYSESSENGVVLETKINNYYYALEYSKAVTLDAGTSSGKAYSNTIEQEISANLSVPLGESLLINIGLGQDLSTQPYTESPDEYKSYTLKKSYDISMAYTY